MHSSNRANAAIQSADRLGVIVLPALIGLGYGIYLLVVESMKTTNGGILTLLGVLTLLATSAYERTKLALIPAYLLGIYMFGVIGCMALGLSISERSAWGVILLALLWIVLGLAAPSWRTTATTTLITSLLTATRSEIACGITRTTRAYSLLPSEAQGRCPQGGGVAAASGGRSRRKGVRSLRSRPSGAVAPPPLRFAGEDFVIASILIVNRGKSAGGIIRTARASSLRPSEAQGRCPQGGGVAASSGGRSRRKGVRSLRSRPSGAFAPPPLRFAGED